MRGRSWRLILGACSASSVAAMVGAAWRRGAAGAHGGDMVGHAAAGEWFGELGWGVWRGWSDWFYGGQAMGVSYPPLSHVWLRLTDPVHGQYAAVAVGLLVLFPWAVRSLARGMRVQTTPATWAALFALTAFAGNAHWLLPGFHSASTGFGSWPAMIASLLGLVCVGRAFDLSRPVAAGVVAGVSVLFNSTVAPGVAVLVLVVLVAGRRGWEAVRWAVTVLAAALSVSAWWLVPFFHGWARLVEWRLGLAEAFHAAGGQVLLVVVLVAAGSACAARLGRRARLLGAAIVAAVLAAGIADAAGYLRTERWVTPATAAAVALCALGASHLRSRSAETDPPDAAERPAGADDSSGEARRPCDGSRGLGPRGRFGGSGLRAWARYAVAAAGTAGAVLAGVWAVLPAVAWVLWGRRWAFVRYGAPAWAALLVAIPAQGLFAPPEREDSAPSAAMTLADRSDEPGSSGFVYLQESFEHTRGGTGDCGWGDPWALPAAGGTGLRPLAGLYRETSSASEFISVAETSRQGFADAYGPPMDQWGAAWAAAPPGSPVDHSAAAEALGARWYVFCDSTDTITARRLAERRVSGVGLSPHSTEVGWHRHAARWWAGLLTGQDTLAGAEGEVPAEGEVDPLRHPPDQAAGGVRLIDAGDAFAVVAETAGWAWVRIPWDPYWHAHDGGPLLKGGPGHIVAWVEAGQNNYGWWVPRNVDIAAVATTAAAAAAALTLLVTDPGRRRTRSTTRRTAPDAAAGEPHAQPAERRGPCGDDEGPAASGAESTT